MGTWSIGSVANAVQNMIPNVPAGISGAQMLDIAERKLQYVNEWTGLSNGSNSIPLRVQPPVMNLTASEVLFMIHTYGGDVHIGDTSFGNSALNSAKMLEERGMKELRAIGRKLQVYKAFG